MDENSSMDLPAARVGDQHAAARPREAAERAYHPPLVSRPYPPPRPRRPPVRVPPVPAESTDFDLVFIVGADATIHYCNRTAADRSDRDVLGTSLLTLAAPAHRHAAREVLARVFAGGSPAGFDCQGTAPFAEDAWYECRVAGNARDGRIVSATVIARDVSHARAAAEEARAAQARLTAELERRATEVARLQGALADRTGRRDAGDRIQALIDQAGEAILVLDPETGRCVGANETACRWLGHTRDHLLTLTSADLDLGLVIDEPDRPREHVADTRSIMRPRLRSGEVPRRRDGTSFPVEVAIVRRRFQGRDFVLLVARDINPRRAGSGTQRGTDESYRSLFELSHDPMYLSARDGTIAEANDAAIALFGYTRDVLIGMPAAKLYARPGDIRAFQQAVGAHGIARDLDVELVTSGGNVVRGRLTARYRHAPDGSVLGYQCLIRPVSQDVPQRAPVRGRSGSADTVLVIDDDVDALRDVRNALERAGIQAVTTQTVAAAVEVVRPQSGDVGVVLLGVRSGEQDSGDAAARIHRADPTVPIVLMSERLMESETPAGVVGVVRKPVYPLALVEQVRQALRR